MQGTVMTGQGEGEDDAVRGYSWAGRGIKDRGARRDRRGKSCAACAVCLRCLRPSSVVLRTHISYCSKYQLRSTSDLRH
jgi:hypothetical protein